MADPDLDKINEITLKELGNDSIYDSIFRESTFMEIAKYSWTLTGWKKVTYKRLVTSGVTHKRAVEVIKEMEATGNYPECPIASLTEFMGGYDLAEPIKYSHVTEVAEWPEGCIIKT